MIAYQHLSDVDAEKLRKAFKNALSLIRSPKTRDSHTDIATMREREAPYSTSLIYDEIETQGPRPPYPGRQ